MDEISYENTINELKENKDFAYWERNQLICYLSKIFPSWREIHPKEDVSWEEEWRNIIFIKFPEGIFSWHIHNKELEFFRHLNFIEGNSWDGSTTEEKYNKLLECMIKR